MEKLAYKTKMTVNLEHVLVVHGADADAMYKFMSEYCLTMLLMDWELLRSRYKGLLISPYSKLLNSYGYNFSIHASWDCASAIVWDLSCVESVGESVNVSDKMTVENFWKHHDIDEVEGGRKNYKSSRQQCAIISV